MRSRIQLRINYDVSVENVERKRNVCKIKFRKHFFRKISHFYICNNFFREEVFHQASSSYFMRKYLYFLKRYLKKILHKNEIRKFWEENEAIHKEKKKLRKGGYLGPIIFKNMFGRMQTNCAIIESIL